MKAPTKAQIKNTANTAVKKAETFVKNPLFFKVVGIAVGGYIIYKVAKGLTNTITKTVEADEPTNNLDIINNGTVTPDPVKTTITKEQARIYAQSLIEASDRFPYGTWDNKILAVFKEITADDFKLIFNEFGTPLYNGYNSPPESWFWQLFDNYTERNLVYWLESELKDSKGTEVYNLVKKIVNEAGFVFE